ncbi:MAG: L17 family ribosomal protein [Mariniblastus sp.]|nr:L17 family ribosomal protein [Mariniblastus sp.]
MRHKKKGRRLGRSSSHRKAMLRNLATGLFLTERDESYYEGLTMADGKSVVNPPRFKGRVVTTIQKAKEVKPLVEKCITIAKNSIPHEEAAEEFATDAERNTEAWKQWRESEKWQKWVTAMAPAVTARRRVFAMLRDKEAVEILFDDVAHRFVDRPGGYTRVLRLAEPRLGDAGIQAILEFVGVHDRVSQVSQKPAFVDDDGEVEDDTAAETEAPADEEAVAEGGEAESTTSEEE